MFFPVTGKKLQKVLFSEVTAAVANVSFPMNQNA